MIVNDVEVRIPKFPVWNFLGGQGGQFFLKIVGPEKKTSEKVLIPLPSTGFASFFCANQDVGKRGRIYFHP